MQHQLETVFKECLRHNSLLFDSGVAMDVASMSYRWMPPSPAHE
jgi:hypothetical protein